jgi:hypothetical protein
VEVKRHRTPLCREATCLTTPSPRVPRPSTHPCFSSASHSDRVIGLPFCPLSIPAILVAARAHRPALSQPSFLHSIQFASSPRPSRERLPSDGSIERAPQRSVSLHTSRQGRASDKALASFVRHRRTADLDGALIRDRTASRASETFVSKPCSIRYLRNCSFIPPAVAWLPANDWRLRSGASTAEAVSPQNIRAM